MVFDQSTLIDLDECVINALNLFAENKLPELNLGNYKRPLVVGSGNAAATGRIIMQDSDAVFADEGTYVQKLDTIPEIDGAILISASGGKHAPIIAKELQKRKIETRLLTNNANAAAKDIIDEDKFFVFPKNPEPYTYNTSTYMGMILAKTKEDSKEIVEFIERKVIPLIPENFIDFDAFYLMVEERFDNMREMLNTKFDELFQPKVSGRTFTPEQSKHAKTVVHSDRELFISFGYENDFLGDKPRRLNIPLPENADYAALMAVSYFVIGHIQQQHPPYFKDNIEAFTKNMSKIFGEEITPVVN